MASGRSPRTGVSVPTDARWTNGIALGGDREAQALAQRGATTEVTRFLGDGTALVPERVGRDQQVLTDAHT